MTRTIKVLTSLWAIGSAAACAGELPVPSKPYSLSEAQLQAVTALVAESLKDPESVRLGKMVAAQSLEKPGQVVVCGVVSDKNSFGSYTGFRPFIGEFSDAANLRSFRVLSFGTTDANTWATGDACRRFGMPQFVTQRQEHL